MVDNKQSQKQEFAKGIFVKEVANGKIINLSINVEKLCENDINEAGYINIDLKKSKDGKLYAVINNWVPNKK